MAEPKADLMPLLIQEYIKLKDEQAKRIGFHDNILYVTLVALGGMLSFSLADPAHYYGFFLIPWITIILAWTYVVNDEKISSLGKYFRQNLAEQISLELTGRTSDEFFGWEGVGRSDTHRIRRKNEQLVINELTFVFSGFSGLLAFFWLVRPVNVLFVFSGFLALLFLITLFVEIIIYADITKGR